MLLSIIYIAVSALSLITCIIYMEPFAGLTITVAIILALNIVSVFIKKNKLFAAIANVVLGLLSGRALLGALSVLNTFL